MARKATQCALVMTWGYFCQLMCKASGGSRISKRDWKPIIRLSFSINYMKIKKLGPGFWGKRPKCVHVDPPLNAYRTHSKQALVERTEQLGFSYFEFKIRLIRLSLSFQKQNFLYLNSQPTDSQSGVTTITPKSGLWVGDTEKLSVAFIHTWLILVEFT